eukprot:CAMPEP_0202062234 /NCGR_PEP_ID=MMETSP0963-20130614/43415_1 /ASSEMBLY_ACC=CAM_ASM_000494 /TAXON_ID=4773 /ORGANISM="Schizochytrium aggregatum, Strain ATCC28209" /LENGTH=58 /DNA_ID=CAMNT_0048628521 /DNA_START=138 /DNA_END=310 /DNA_ORIENTATION=+
MDTNFAAVNQLGAVANAAIRRWSDSVHQAPDAAGAAASAAQPVPCLAKHLVLTRRCQP